MRKKRNKKFGIIVRWRLFIICIILLCIPNIYLPKYLLNNDKIVDLDLNYSSDEFKVMSYNIRYWNFLDIGKKSWFYRAGLILDSIQSIKPDIIGFQEVTSLQYNFFQKKLEDYSSIIVYRDHMPWSEGCPIFYNERRYNLLETETFWLSETPYEVSKGWDASNYRVCSYVLLVDQQTNLEFAIFNTHLDNRSEEARVKGMEVICDKIDQLGDMPIIMMGDLNSTESSETYKYITEKFDDTRHVATQSMLGNTYQNWGRQEDNSLIDYIMVSPGKFFIKRYFIGEQIYKGAYPSDHFPVCVELERMPAD